MNFSPAPFHVDLSEAPAESRAWWVTTRDDLRVRVAHVPSDGAQGTILLFPGRTEYCEKYGRVAAQFAQAGYHTLIIDWRGQGLADRMLDDVRTGHVAVFDDYQEDVDAMLKIAHWLGVPGPRHLLAHSMGGCIGLRAVYNGLDVASAHFTGPMWGIQMAPTLRPAAWAVSRVSKSVGLSHLFAPGTKPENYVIAEPFEDNMLTTDPEGFDYMRRQMVAIPELQLGGPSLHWLHEALAETRALSKMPPLDLPGTCFCGTNERIVDVDRIRHRMKRWSNGQLEMIEGGEHEVLMEAEKTRRAVINKIVALCESTLSDQALSA